MITSFWIGVVAFVVASIVKATIKHDCLRMIEMPSQLGEKAQKWLNWGINAAFAAILLPVGPVVKDFVVSSAHAIQSIHDLEKRNSEVLQHTLDNLDA